MIKYLVSGYSSFYNKQVLKIFTSRELATFTAKKENNVVFRYMDGENETANNIILSKSLNK